MNMFLPIFDKRWFDCRHVDLLVSMLCQRMACNVGVSAALTLRIVSATLKHAGLKHAVNSLNQVRACVRVCVAHPLASLIFCGPLCRASPGEIILQRSNSNLFEWHEVFSFVKPISPDIWRCVHFTRPVVCPAVKQVLRFQGALG